jgi:serine/threonine protein kinase
MLTRQLNTIWLQSLLHASLTVLQLLLALKHPNIVRCKECFTSGSKLCIVMDWCSEGEQHCCMLLLHLLVLAGCLQEAPG